MRFCQRKNNRNIVHVGFFPPLKCKLHTRCPVVGLKFFLDIECNQRCLLLAFSVSFLEILFATYQTSNWCCKCGKFFFMSDRILTWRSVATTFMLAPLSWIFSIHLLNPSLSIALLLVTSLTWTIWKSLSWSIMVYVPYLALCPGLSHRFNFKLR